MRVYHFVDTTFAISNISLRRLKISRFNELNDPFELLAADLLNPKHHSAFAKLKKVLNDTTGMICFSKSWSNPLIWGHYANKHRGIALGFDIPDEYLTEVKYTTQRAPVTFDQTKRKVLDGEAVLQQIIRTKFLDWKYEEEHRMFVKLKESQKEGSFYFNEFSDSLQLREVILGLNCDLSVVRARQLLGGDLSSVKVLKAGLALRNFKIIEDRSARVSS